MDSSSSSSAKMSEEQFRARYQILEDWLAEIEHKLTLNSPAQDDFNFEEPEDLLKQIETNERITFHMKEKETRDKFMGLIPIAKILAREPTFDMNWVKCQCQLITKKYRTIRDMAKEQRAHLNDKVNRLMGKLIQDIDDLTKLMEERRNLILNSGPDSERLIKSNMEDSFSAIQLLENWSAHVTKVFSAHRAKVNIQSKMGDLQEKYSELDEIFSKRHDWFQLVSQVKAEEDWIAEKQEWLGKVDHSHLSRDLIETSLTRLDEFEKILPVHIRIVNELEGTLSSFKGVSHDRVKKLKKTLDHCGISVAKVKQDMTINFKSFKFYYQAYLTRSLIAEKEKESTTFNEESAHDLESLRTIQTKQDNFDRELESLEKGGVAALHKIKEDMTEDELTKCDLITKTFDEIVHRWETLISSNQRRKKRIQSRHENFTQVAIAELRREIGERSEAFLKFLERCRSLKMDTSDNPVDAEANLNSLESLVSDLETHKGQSEPESRRLVAFLRESLESVTTAMNEYERERIEAWAEFRRLLGGSAQRLSSWVTLTSSAILNLSGSTAEQLQQMEGIIAEMEEPELKVKLIQELESMTKEHLPEDSPLVSRDLAQSWDEFKRLALSTKKDLQDPEVDQDDNSQVDGEDFADMEVLDEFGTVVPTPTGSKDEVLELDDDDPPLPILDCYADVAPVAPAPQVRCSARIRERRLKNNLSREPSCSRCGGTKIAEGLPPTASCSSRKEVLPNAEGIQPKEKMFKCVICGIAYTAYSSLWSHNKKVHPREFGTSPVNPKYEQERIIWKRTVKDRSIQYLVQFEGRPAKDNLWMPSGAITRTELINDFENRYRLGEEQKRSPTVTVTEEVRKKRTSAGSDPTTSQDEEVQDQDGPRQMAQKKIKLTSGDTPNTWSQIRLPEKITGVKAGPDGSSLFVLKLKDSDDTIMVREALAKSKYPQLVSAFYEESIG